MSENQYRGAGRFNTAFTIIPAGVVHVEGLPFGAAGSCVRGPLWLTSTEAVMTISPDTAGAVAKVERPPLVPKRFMPRRPASQTEAEFLSLAE